MPPSQPSELISRVHVVEGASLSFVEVGEAKTDTWEIEWEATPAAAERTEHRPPPVSPKLVNAPLPPPPQPPARAVEPAAPRAAPSPTPAIEPVAPPPARRAMPEPEMALEPGGLRVPEGIGRSPAALDAFPSVFRGLSPATVAAAVGHFDVFEVQAGTTLIEAGEHHPALVMVLGGELRAMRGDSMRIASEGECLGVTTLFGDGRWASTLRAVVPSRLLVLDLEGFRALREQGSVVSVAVEEYALDTLMDALDRARQRVGQLVRGKPLKTFVPSPGFFGLIADAFGMGGIMSTQLPAARLLADSPLFRNADSAHIAALAERFIGLRAQAGTFLLTQGVSNTSMFVVASGTVDLLTASTDNSAVCHETLGPGQMFGIWGLLRELPSRTSVVAKQNCTVLELEKLAWADLAPAHTGTGSVLRLAVLRALTGRLVQEAAKLAALEAGEVPVVVDTSDSFKTINPIDRR